MSDYRYTGPRHTTDYQSSNYSSRINTLILMSRFIYLYSNVALKNLFSSYLLQDGSGWTPLMIAASLKNAEGDAIIDLLLRKDADVNIKSVSGQVRYYIKSFGKIPPNVYVSRRTLFTSQLPRPISPQSKPSLPINAVHESKTDGASSHYTGLPLLAQLLY
jgi:ankyrin repeat protein